MNVLNVFVKYIHFKMENVNSLIDLLRPNDFIATIDLKDAYFTVPIHQDYSKYLRFWWNGLYEFTVLPFGLSSSPRVFTKVMKPILAFCRGKGIRVVIYRDDIAVPGVSYDDCLSNVAQVISILERMGFIINRKKSQLTPCQAATYLGNFINSCEFKISLPPDKLFIFSDSAKDLLARHQCSLREVARFIGLAISSFRAVLPAKLHFRSLERFKIACLKQNNNNFDATVRPLQT